MQHEAATTVYDCAHSVLWTCTSKHAGLQAMICFHDKQALRALKDLHQQKAFAALLEVALAEASKVNDTAQAAQMLHLEVSMLIAAGEISEALNAGQQVCYTTL